VGRVFFNEIWPEALGYMKTPCPRRKLEELIFRCYQIAGHEETVRVLDRLKQLGFEHATRPASPSV
jgi:DNA-directed RNA polymerase subunit beta'